jgi:hypothetical protein
MTSVVANQRQAAQGPPQSMPASPPFCIASEHVGASQTAAQQTPLTQSALDAQPLPSAHFVPHAATPQSASVSPSFFMLSEHDGSAHIPWGEQTLSLQSLPWLQLCPAAHGEHEPPQRSFATHIPGTQSV